MGLDPSDLRRISKEALEEVLDELGSLDFTTAQARALVAAAKEAWDEEGDSLAAILYFDVCLLNRITYLFIYSVIHFFF